MFRFNKNKKIVVSKIEERKCTNCRKCTVYTGSVEINPKVTFHNGWGITCDKQKIVLFDDKTCPNHVKGKASIFHDSIDNHYFKNHEMKL